ncbi:unnamed protein product, partial [Didymodactylos carnosus]
FNPALLQPLNGLCGSPNTYVSQVPVTYSTSFIDLYGNYYQLDLENDNFIGLINMALQRLGIINTASNIFVESRFGLDMSLITRVYYTVSDQTIPQNILQTQLQPLFMAMQPIKYNLFNGQSIARADAHQYIANITLPLTVAQRQQIENYLTSYNTQYGIAKIVYAENIDNNQTRFYVVFVNGTQLLTRCDFSLYYPGVSAIGGNAYYSIFLERNGFVSQPAALADGLAQLWTNQNIGVTGIFPGVLYVQLQNQEQYICQGGRRSIRVNYVIKTLSSVVNIDTLQPPSNTAFEQLYGQFVNTSRCYPYRAHWIYSTEPRPSNDIIRTALQNAWRQTNNNSFIVVSPDFSIDQTYLTNSNQPLTRLIYTININGSDVTPLTASQPSTSTLPTRYTGIPFKQYTIYIDGSRINLTSAITLQTMNQAIRTSWSIANGNLFTANDLIINNISNTLVGNGQTKVDYTIGLRDSTQSDIGDYMQPSERLYTQVFNQSMLPTSPNPQCKPKSIIYIFGPDNSALLMPLSSSSSALFNETDVATSRLTSLSPMKTYDESYISEHYYPHFQHKNLIELSEEKQHQQLQQSSSKIDRTVNKPSLPPLHVQRLSSNTVDMCKSDWNGFDHLTTYNYNPYILSQEQQVVPSP